MNKAHFIISNCDHCPSFDNEYYTYRERCLILDRQIIQDDNYKFAIPDDCPCLLKPTEAKEF